MDDNGRAIDNIFVERLWRSDKYEHVYILAFHFREKDETRNVSCKHYINRFHNRLIFNFIFFCRFIYHIR
jgi:hypothetical protein